MKLQLRGDFLAHRPNPRRVSLQLLQQLWPALCMEAPRYSFASGTSGMSLKKRLARLASRTPHLQPDQAGYIRHDQKAVLEVGTNMTAIVTFSSAAKTIALTDGSDGHLYVLFLADVHAYFHWAADVVNIFVLSIKF